jgi:hypothetical protein
VNRLRKTCASGFSAALVFAIVASPSLARACSVCVDPEAENRTAFIITTVLLSVLPLLLVGGLVAWLWRRAALIEAEASLAGDQLGRVTSPLARAGSSRSTSSR